MTTSVATKDMNRAFSDAMGDSAVFETDTVRRAMTELEAVHASRLPVTVVTGPIGSGKTFIVRAHLSALEDGTEHAFISGLRQGETNVLPWVRMAFGLDPEDETQPQAYLAGLQADNRQVILAVDEAQHLTRATVGQIVKLSMSEPALCVILIGWASKPGDTTAQSGKTRAEPIIKLEAFTPAETRGYIQFHLRQAGMDEDFFSEAQCAWFHRATDGNARLINIVGCRAVQSAPDPAGRFGPEAFAGLIEGFIDARSLIPIALQTPLDDVRAENHGHTPEDWSALARFAPVKPGEGRWVSRPKEVEPEPAPEELRHQEKPSEDVIHKIMWEEVEKEVKPFSPAPKRQHSDPAPLPKYQPQHSIEDLPTSIRQALMDAPEDVPVRRRLGLARAILTLVLVVVGLGTTYLFVSGGLQNLGNPIVNDSVLPGLSPNQVLSAGVETQQPADGVTPEVPVATDTPIVPEPTPVVETVGLGQPDTDAVSPPSPAKEPDATSDPAPDPNSVRDAPERPDVNAAPDAKTADTPTATVDPAPVDTALTGTAPVDAAPTSTAPTDTAPTDTAPTDSAPTDTATTAPGRVEQDPAEENTADAGTADPVESPDPPRPAADDVVDVASVESPAPSQVIGTEAPASEPADPAAASDATPAQDAPKPDSETDVVFGDDGQLLAMPPPRAKFLSFRYTIRLRSAEVDVLAEAVSGREISTLDWVLAAEPVASGNDVTVSYFHDVDKAGAQAIVSALRNRFVLGPKITLRDYRTFEPAPAIGTLELRIRR